MSCRGRNAVPAQPSQPEFVATERLQNKAAAAYLSAGPANGEISDGHGDESMAECLSEDYRVIVSAKGQIIEPGTWCSTTDTRRVVAPLWLPILNRRRPLCKSGLQCTQKRLSLPAQLNLSSDRYGSELCTGSREVAAGVPACVREQ